MGDQWWSWALTLIGVTGFWLAGRKIWFAWYINISNQALWLAYAVTTQQWGFLLSVPVYLAVFVPNAYRWTRERFPPVKGEPCGFCEEPIDPSRPRWFDPYGAGPYCSNPCMTADLDTRLNASYEPLTAAELARQDDPEWRP